MPCGFFCVLALCPAKSGLRLTTYLGRGGVIPSSSALQAGSRGPWLLPTPRQAGANPQQQRRPPSGKRAHPNHHSASPQAHITLPEAATLPLRNHIPGSISMRTRASSRGSPLFFSDSVTRNMSPPLTAASGLRRARDSRSEELEMELKLDDGEAEGEAETTSLMRRASKTLLSEEERRGMGGGRVRGAVGGDGWERVAGGGDGWMTGVADGDGLALWSCAGVGVVVSAGCGCAESHRARTSGSGFTSRTLVILLEFLLGTGMAVEAASRAAGRENPRSCWRRVMKRRVSKAGPPQARLDATTTTRTWDMALRPSRRVGCDGLGFGVGRREEDGRHRSGDSLDSRDLANLGMARRRKMHEPRMESRESEMGWIISRRCPDQRWASIYWLREDYGSGRFRDGRRRHFAPRPLPPKKPQRPLRLFTWRWQAVPP